MAFSVTAPKLIQTAQAISAIQDLETACFPGIAWTAPQIAASLQSAGFRVILIQPDGSVQEYQSPDSSNPEPGFDRNLKADQAAGYALVQTLEAEATDEILRLGIRQEYRRKGLGSILLEFLEAINANFSNRGDYSRSPGRHLLLEVSAENIPALQLYQGRGFEELSRRRAYYGPHNGSGVRTDAIVLRKRIQTPGTLAR